MSKDYSKVLIATPIRGNSTITLYSAGMLMSTGLHGGWLPLAGQSDIYVARNVLANEFISRKEFDTLVWIDSDIGFSRQDLQNLIDSDEEMVSGLYTDKCQPPAPFCRGEDGMNVALADIPKQGMIKARFVPGGFLKVERSVYEKIIAAKAVPRYSSAAQAQLVEEIMASDLCNTTKQTLVADITKVESLVGSYGGGKFHHFYNGRIAFDNLLSEDYSFCEVARDAGVQPWINCGIRLSHDGRTLDPQPQVAQPNPPLSTPNA